MKYVRFTLAIALTALIVILSSTPNLVLVKDNSRVDEAVSNLAHIPAYGALSLAWIYAVMDLSKKQNCFRVYSYTIMALLLFAISDEVHQFFVLGRTASLSDFILDTIGIASGLLVVSLVHIHTKRRV